MSDKHQNEFEIPTAVVTREYDWRYITQPVDRIVTSKTLTAFEKLVLLLD